MIITGYVEQKVGKGTDKGVIWALKVDGTRYGFYTTEPKCKEGDYVSFEAVQKGDFWNANAKTLKPATPQAGTPASTAAQAAPAPTRAGTKPWVPDDKRQDAISYQAARNSAIETLKLMASVNALPIPAKGKEGEKYDITLSILDELTMRYFDDTKRLSPPQSNSEPKEAQVNNLDPDDELPF